MSTVKGRYILFFLVSLQFAPSVCRAETQCLDADGEAVIVNNDLPSAKAEAISRAKWAAVEHAVGVEVRAQSVVQNMALVDEAISKQVNGSVKSYRLLSQDSKHDTIAVRINACVEPAKAKEVVAGLALNNSISVFLLAKDPAGRIKGYQESNTVAEAVIDKLASKGFTVTDIAATRALESKAVDSALENGKLLGLRGLMYKFLSNILLIGKVEYLIATKKGDDAGYGITMPFNTVKARLTYRLISKNAAGEMIILAAGTGQGKGLANTVQDAAAESLNDLAENVIPAILLKVEQHLQGVSKKVAIRVNGISELSDNFAVKEVLQNLAWVTSVDEKGLGEFSVSYPENPIYLANSLRQKGCFRIEAFTPDSITVEYGK
jgi:hypothetical protein